MYESELGFAITQGNVIRVGGTEKHLPLNYAAPNGAHVISVSQRYQNQLIDQKNQETKGKKKEPQKIPTKAAEIIKERRLSKYAWKMSF